MHKIEDSKAKSIFDALAKSLGYKHSSLVEMANGWYALTFVPDLEAPYYIFVGYVLNDGSKMTQLLGCTYSDMLNRLIESKSHQLFVDIYKTTTIPSTYEEWMIFADIN